MLVVVAGVQRRAHGIPLLICVLHTCRLNLKTHDARQISLDVLVVQDGEPGVIVQKVLLLAPVLWASGMLQKCRFDEGVEAGWQCQRAHLRSGLETYGVPALVCLERDAILLAHANHG